MDNNWISLCKVNRPDRNNDIWLKRLADIIDDQIIKVTFDEDQEMIFDNRMFLFRKDGPKEPDAFGLWKWSERQNESGRWLADATYIGNHSLIEVLVFNTVAGIDELIQALRTGVIIPLYVNNKVLFVIVEDNIYKGVLCDLSNCNTQHNDNDKKIQLKNSIFSLPYFELNDSDMVRFKYRLFYNRTTLDNPIKRLPTYPIDDSIKQMFIQRLSWPIFKSEGISKSDWRRVIHLLKDVPNESMIQRLSILYGISDQESQERIESFLQTVEQHIDVEDVDSGLIVKMLENHEGLKESCDKIAYQKWLKEHTAELAAAKKEVEEIRTAGEKEVEAANQRLNSVKKSIDEAEKERLALTSHIEQAQSRIGELQAEIDRYEKLGKDTVAAVRQKIAESQEDIAGFIANLSMFLPHAVSSSITSRENGWQYICTSCKEADDDVETTENWKDELNLLSQNLSYSLNVSSELCEMLSALLYSAYIHRFPLLVVGPGGQEVADCLSSSLFGSCSGKLIIGEGIGYDVFTTVNGCDEQIVSACNMFGKGWNDELPLILSKCNKQIIWTHPYAEDMLIEPKGIYNYMIPVLSEVFAESIADFDYLLGKRSENFKELALGNNIPILIGAIKQLGISKLLLNHIELVLSGAKAIMGNESRNKDLEILFGLLPLSVLTDKTDLLKETIDNESGISEFVKEIATRYCDEG